MIEQSLWNYQLSVAAEKALLTFSRNILHKFWLSQVLLTIYKQTFILIVTADILRKNDKRTPWGRSNLYNLYNPIENIIQLCSSA